MKKITKNLFVLFFGLLFFGVISFFSTNTRVVLAEEGEITVVDGAITTTPTAEFAENSDVPKLEENVSPPVLETEPSPVVTSEAAPVVIIDPVISTDKEDYHPGENVSIFGRFFKSLQEIVLKIFGSDDYDNNYTEQSNNVTTDDNGAFSSIFNLDNIYRPFYEMTASALDGTLLAKGIFRDSAIGTYDQCSNDDGDGYATGDTGCRWINGNLNKNNSTYHEGDSTVQRLWIKGYAPGSTHSITLQYGTTKGGKHAYDFLTSWDHSENWIALSDLCQGIDGCATGTDNFLPVPHDPNGSGLHETAGRNFLMRGGTLTGASTPVLNGSYTGDSETSITLNFTVDSLGSMCTTKGGVTSCGVALFFGAHISDSKDWNPELTAISIPGSPYHVALSQEDGASVGQRDNQMQAEAIVTPPTAVPAILTLQKTVITDNGGTALDTDWTLTATGTDTISGVESSPNVTNASVQAGTYTLSESGGPDGYTASDWVCTGAIVTNGNQITLADAQVATCVITNDDQPGTLIVNKVLPNDDGGMATPSQFSFSVNGGVAAPFESDGSNSMTVNAGTYNVVETNPMAGYDVSYDNCSNVVVPNGGTATCTITNDDQPAYITVIKEVINDNGGNAESNDFNLTLGGNSVVSGEKVKVSPGTYVAAETNLPGYEFKGFSGECDTNGSVTVALGESKTCTLTNDDQAAHLIIIKHVNNDNGGNKVASDFSTTISGVTTSNQTAAGAEAPGVDNILTSVGEYSVDEGDHVGYAKSLSSDCNGIIALGETKTCIITNDDIAPKLTLVKTVVNDNGGTLSESDFPSFVDGQPQTWGVATEVIANKQLTASETNKPGYMASAWGGDCASDGTITLLPGDDKTCTITNDDIQPKLTLIKVVQNDNGGQAVISDFPLFVDSTSVVSGESNGFNAGTYKASETNRDGYEASSWAGDCSSDGTITLGVGDNKTCTITNDDIAPKLHLRKVVLNDNGGTATVADFTLTADGTTTNDLTGASPVDSGVTLQSDTFVLSENNVPGYTASEWSCVGGTQNGSSVTVGIGEEATCTITNDDIAPKLTLVKVVSNDNGGEALATDWILSADGPTSISGAGGVVSGGTFSAGTYALSESSGPSGYKASSWSCVGGNQNGSNLTLTPGQEATCTITNDDEQSYITVIKKVITNNGGTAQPNDFNLTLAGGPVLSGVAVPVNPGTYTATETQIPGYSFTGFSGDCDSSGSVTVALGESKTCTLTNDDIVPKLIVIKHVINNDGDEATASDFTMHIAGGATNLSKNDFGGNESGVEVTLNAGTYSVDELDSRGYVKTLSQDCSGSIAVGETKTCTITNDDKPHATRTQGFWQTHTNYTSSVFGGQSWTIGSHVIDTQQELFSGFYSSISKTSVGKKRTAVDQARMQMLQQWLAAKLNCEAFGCSLATQSLLTNSATAWGNINATAAQILSYASQLDAYNNSNDALPIAGQGKATPKDSQSLAGSAISDWNVLP